ncbi:MAG TPA: DUF2782 domain-containing protein [Halothiobacillus sp.]|nr:DUF2782 domain-containing protein [Halothiobacillus sp.]
MIMKLNALIITFFLTASSSVVAQEEPPIPPLPDEGKYAALAELEEAEIIIRRTEDGRVREFRRGGRTYMIEVIPDNAPPYHIVDHNGDGDLSQRHEGPYDPKNLPRWVLFSW